MMDLDRLRALGRESPVTFHEGTTKWKPVEHSRELTRILAIPSFEVDPFELAGVRELVERADAPEPRMRLWPDQARALLSAAHGNGLFAPIVAGAGKTLICVLLPTVLDTGPSVILTTPQLVRQGETLTREYRRHFHIRSDIRWLAYSTLSSAQHAQSLVEMNPKLIIADEAHCLKDLQAARTKRFVRYMREHPDTIFCALSGTMTKKSLLDFAHLLKMALGDWTPLPRDYPTLKEWSEALDAGAERPAGALRIFAVDGKTPRQGWHEKMASVRGVCCSDDSRPDVELSLVQCELEEPPEVDAALRHLHKMWETPDGEWLTYAVEVARVDRQLRLGGYYKHVWPEAMSQDEIAGIREIRRTWFAIERDILAHRSRPGLDSPKLVRNAIKRGELHGAVELERFENALQPTPVWEWLTDAVLRSAVEYIQTISPCIVWTDTPPVGRAMAKLLGAPYYGSGPSEGLLQEDGSRTVVASIQAHHVGKNLQAFCRAYVFGAVVSADRWEQLLARLHRSGQKRDVVFHVPFPGELETACENAIYLQEISGTPQRLLYASVL